MMRKFAVSAGIFALSVALPMILMIPRTAVGAPVGTYSLLSRSYSKVGCTQEGATYACAGIFDSSFPSSTLRSLYVHIQSFTLSQSANVNVAWVKTSYTGTVYIDQTSATVPAGPKTVIVTAKNVKLNPHAYDSSALLVQSTYASDISLTGYTYLHNAI